jgi:hypothetical protein
MRRYSQAGTRTSPASDARRRRGAWISHLQPPPASASGKPDSDKVLDASANHHAARRLMGFADKLRCSSTTRVRAGCRLHARPLDWHDFFAL